MTDYFYNGTVIPDNSSTEFSTSLSTEFGITMTAKFGTTIFKSTDLPQYTYEASSLLTTSELSSSVNPSDDIEFVFDSLPQRAFIAALILLASTVGIFGNSLVILAVLASRKLRTVTNVFVFNLAVADLLVSLTLPWNAVALIAVDGWPLSQHLCSAVAGILFVSVGCSVYTLASIAVNRWVVITQSRKVSQRLFRPKLLCIWITLTWLIPFTGTIIPPLVGFGKLGYNTKYGSCSNVSKNPYSDEYDILSAMIIYPIPLVIIVVAYVKTFLHVRKHSVKLAKYQAKKKDRLESCSSIGHSEDFTSYSEKNHKMSYEMDETITSRVSNTSNSNGCNEHDTNFGTSPKEQVKDSASEQNFTSHRPSGSSTKEQVNGNASKQTYTPQTNTKSTSRSSSVRANIVKRFSKDRIRKLTIRPRLSHRELVITKNMFYIVVVFLVCLSPFAFCLFIDSSDPVIPYAAAVVFFNSCLNPIVYATKHPYFKKVFGLIIKCKLRDIPEPSGCLKTMLNTCCGSEVTYV